MRVRSRNILRSRNLADQNLRVIAAEGPQRNHEDQLETNQNKNDLIIEDDINPC